MAIVSPFGTPARQLRVRGEKRSHLGKKYSLVEDRRRNVLFVSPYPTAAETRAFYAGRYSGDTATESDYSGSERKAIAQLSGMKAYLARNRVRPASLLDVACGSGYFVDVALREGFDGFGFDFESSGIESAVRNFPHLRDRLIAGTISDVDLPRDSFATITILDALEHMLDPIANLRAVNNLLQRRGLLFIQSIYYDNGFPETDSFTDPQSGKSLLGWPAFSQNHSWEHVMIYSIKGMAYVLEEAGFMLNGVFKTAGHSCPIVVAQKAKRGQVHTARQRVIAEYHQFDVGPRS
ncbi:MAG: class I SAM-dependent methyltransferase [Candidatus Margulisbacteria bacterium]|nr:class I SAM-dependent methyltransferase [Candidatus Margulisiibacteriota bacterium]MBU1021023.1 class I SAM-dependent methyltransferase [Candidatus Margulisiibacteriota bacterium]MBU1729259.1 class I SAM-dependent methyltransferase [Candidatus Margulisiibacteriota bacterium]MBU1955532.1 class I SAM-dependent methyltransferase [Candidatus Margulisiibacteriota bacterium]